MFDAITLDQLRTFIAVVDEGSFSSAGRKLRRVQSAVSHAMANLETNLGVRIWDRSTRIPMLTAEGNVLLTHARRICADVDALRHAAEALMSGLEPCVSLAVESILPESVLVDLCKEFAKKFPTVQLRLYTDTLSAVSARVLDGTCHIGVVGPAAQVQGLERHHLTSVRLVTVVAADHPLARKRGKLKTQELAEYVHVVLSESGGSSPTEDQGVLSSNGWRIANLGTKRALILGGLGWGNLPEHMVKEELASGRLVRLKVAAWGDDTWLLSLSIVHRPELSKGPAARWMLQRMAELCLRDIGRPGGPH